MYALRGSRYLPKAGRSMNWLAGLKCKDPRWRCLFVVLAALAVIVAALFLYVIGLLAGAGIFYLLAVILLFVFALAGAIAVGLLIYGLFRRWCELRGAVPKGKGTRESSGPSTVHLPPTIYKRPDPMIYQPILSDGARPRRDLGQSRHLAYRTARPGRDDGFGGVA